VSFDNPREPLSAVHIRQQTSVINAIRAHLAEFGRTSDGYDAASGNSVAWDVCENNELRTYCISIKPLSMSGR
jgi:hypothetical protein